MGRMPEKRASKSRMKRRKAERKKNKKKETKKQRKGHMMRSFSNREKGRELFNDNIQNAHFI